MIYRTLGSMGERVSAIGVGGWHLGLKHVDEELSLRIVRSAIDRGELDALLAKTAGAAATGQYEPFKTTSIFDSTAQNPEWLGEEPPRVRQLMQS